MVEEDKEENSKTYATCKKNSKNDVYGMVMYKNSGYVGFWLAEEDSTKEIGIKYSCDNDGDFGYGDSSKENDYGYVRIDDIKDQDKFNPFKMDRNGR